jgi:hypothetical protein
MGEHVGRLAKSRPACRRAGTTGMGDARPTLVPLDVLPPGRAWVARAELRLIRLQWAILGKKPLWLCMPDAPHDRPDLVPTFDLVRARMVALARDVAGNYYVIPIDWQE